MTRRAPDAAPHALVLGGGGLAGIAWEVGVLVGLADEGVDVTGASRVQGTSAGAVVGALIATGTDLAALHERHGEVPGREPGSRTPLGDRFAGAPEVVRTGDRRDREVRAEVGAWALSVDAGPEAARREVIAARLPEHRWPEADRVDLRITAVRADNEECDLGSGVAGGGDHIESRLRRATFFGMLGNILDQGSVADSWLTVEHERFRTFDRD